MRSAMSTSSCENDRMIKEIDQEQLEKVGTSPKEMTNQNTRLLTRIDSNDETQLIIESLVDKSKENQTCINRNPQNSGSEKVLMLPIKEEVSKVTLSQDNIKLSEKVPMSQIDESSAVEVALSKIGKKLSEAVSLSQIDEKPSVELPRSPDNEKSLEDVPQSQKNEKLSGEMQLSQNNGKPSGVVPSSQDNKKLSAKMPLSQTAENPSVEVPLSHIVEQPSEVQLPQDKGKSSGEDAMPFVNNKFSNEVISKKLAADTTTDVSVQDADYLKTGKDDDELSTRNETINVGSIEKNSANNQVRCSVGSDVIVESAHDDVNVNVDLVVDAMLTIGGTLDFNCKKELNNQESSTSRQGKLAQQLGPPTNAEQKVTVSSTGQEIIINRISEIEFGKEIDEKLTEEAKQSTIEGLFCFLIIIDYILILLGDYLKLL